MTKKARGTPGKDGSPARSQGPATSDHRGLRVLPVSLVFPANVLAPVPTGAAPDNLLLASVRAQDIVVGLPCPVEATYSDTVQLILEGQPFGNEILVDPYVPDKDIPFTIPSDQRVAEGAHAINYKLIYRSGAGQEELGPPKQTFVVDYTAPGGQTIAAMGFAADVIADAVTPDRLASDAGGDEYLPGRVLPYFEKTPGDTIQVYIDDAPVMAPVYVDIQDVDRDIEVRFPRDLLESIGDASNAADGKHGFTVQIEDRAGNRSVPTTSEEVRLLFRLGGAIVDLQPPLVPAANDGLVTEDEAHVAGGVAVDIPGHPAIMAGDAILLLWNTRQFGPVTVDATQVGQDPLLRMTALYGDVYDDWMAIAADTDRSVPATVSYRVLRGTSPIGEPKQPAIVSLNLFVPGGKDPKPETPEHENMLPPVVQAAGGAPPNIVPPDAVDTDAIATIPGMTANVPHVPAFRAGDRVQLFWDGQKVDSEFVVTTAGMDVTRTVPKAVLIVHSPGAWDVHYTVTRTLATPPFVNTAISPTQVVEVKDITDLPGEGKPLAPAKWVEGPAAEGDPDHIDYDKALSDGGTPVRIYAYGNMAANDVVSIAFHGYDSITPPGGNLVPGAEHALDYVVVPDDLIPKRDDTVDPPVDAVFIDFVIPTDKLLAISYGRGTFDYNVANGVGNVSAEQTWIYISTRPPGS